MSHYLFLRGFRVHMLTAAGAAIMLNLALSARAQDSPLAVKMKDGSSLSADSVSFRDGQFLVLSKGTTQTVAADKVESFAMDYSMIRTLKQQTDLMRAEQARQKQTLEKQNQTIQDMLDRITNLRSIAETKSKPESTAIRKPADDQKRIDSLKRQLEQDQQDQQRAQREQEQRLRDEERKRKDQDERQRRAAFDNEPIIYKCSNCGNTFVRKRKDGAPSSNDGPACVDRSGKKRTSHSWQKQN